MTVQAYSHHRPGYNSPMCGRFVSPEEATIERYWHLGRHTFKLLPRRFNVFPTDTVQFLRRPSNSEGLELATGRWGLVPHWWKEAKPPKMSFNARAEEAAGKPMWRDAWSRARCLIPAEGWYEWQAVERVDPATGEIKRAKQPHFIRHADGRGAFRGSAHEYWAVDPADLEADIGRIVVVAHVFRDRERPYRRVDAVAQADRDLILGLEQPRQIGVLVREHARAYVVLSDDIGRLADAVFIAEDIGGHDLRPVVRRRQDAALGAHRGCAQVSRVASGEALQRCLQADVGMAGRQKIPLPVYRNLHGGFQHEIPGRRRRRDRIAQAERGIEQPAVRSRIQKGLRIFQIEDDVDGVALDRGPAERVEAESLVEALDRAVHETAAVVHGAEGGVDAPMLGQPPVQGHVEQPELEIDEIGLAGQRADRRQVRRSEAAASGQRLEVLLHVRTHRPRVLVAEKDFDGPVPRRSPDGVRGTHVQPQKAERREIALAQQAEFRVLLRRSVLRGRGPEQEKKEERHRAEPA